MNIVVKVMGACLEIFRGVAFNFVGNKHRSMVTEPCESKPFSSLFISVARDMKMSIRRLVSQQYHSITLIIRCGYGRLHMILQSVPLLNNHEADREIAFSPRINKGNVFGRLSNC